MVTFGKIQTSNGDIYGYYVSSSDGWTTVVTHDKNVSIVKDEEIDKRSICSQSDSVSILSLLSPDKVLSETNCQ